MKDEQVVSTDPTNPETPATDPDTTLNTPVVTDPQNPVNLSTGLPEDAVLQPEDVAMQNTQGQDAEGDPKGAVEDEHLKKLEEKADALRNPQGDPNAQQSDPNAQTQQPAITDPNAQQGTPSESQRIANIEAWIASQAQQPVTQQPTQQSQELTGAGSAYSPDPYAQSDPYAQNDPYAQAQPPVQQSQPQQPTQEPVNQNVIMDWMAYLYNQNEQLSRRLDGYESQQNHDAQKSEFRERYNVSDDTIDRAVALAQGGDVLDAFTLLEGRSHAGQANEQARVQRQQDRELAGTPTMNGGAPQQSDPNNQVAAAKAAYEAASALPPGVQKDNAMIQFRNDFGELARTFMETQVGGTLTTQAVVSPVPGA